MPKSTKSKLKKTSPAPPDFAKIQPVIQQYKTKLRQAQLTPLTQTTHSTTSSTWPITKILHQCTRYVSEMHAQHKINDACLEWLLLQDYVDGALLKKWRKRGYEKLCCVACVNTGGSGRCVCRVPKVEMLRKHQRAKNEDADDESKSKDKDEIREIDVECVTCGCRGCASTD
ncbi:uncharacterized protein LODBEIA_P06800 [Lodderomyces beijingensis]|uniref:Bud site selection protein 31 n=1 Tax=Lodderomyces beijingensis TaxID=1775926 RepID=A0ABP0ZH65_9ASCO